MIKSNNKSAFTLVELIVVITILAILWTIAFISLQWYSRDSRDSVRISDIASIKTWLELFQLDSGKYPLPTEKYEITYSWALAWTQWYFWAETTVNVDKLDKVPKDPLTDKMYVYSTTNTRQEFQIAQVMEWDEVSIITNDKLLITNASEKTARLKIGGTYNGRILKVSTWGTDYVLAVPSIIANSWTTLENIIKDRLLAYNGYKNLPFQYAGTYKVDWETELNLVNTGSFVVFSWSLADLTDTTTWTTARVNLLTSLRNAYSGTTIQWV
jgi:prepilin-type N-terminal cleavage/methylation domain-containing protein